MPLLLREAVNLRSFDIFLLSLSALICFLLRTAAQEKVVLPDTLEFSLPLKKLSLTSPYGYRVHPVTGQYRFHAGIDLRARYDTVYAVLPGSVSATGYNSFLGVYIRLNHGEFQTVYGHLSRIFVLPGDSVHSGSAIGVSGATGRLTGAHLHFSVQLRYQYIDPLIFLQTGIKYLINKK